MKASVWPEELDDVWAKSAERGLGQKPETLVQHTWAVLCTLSELAHLRPDWPGTRGNPRLWHHLFWGAYLHDWGKAASGFQNRLRGGERWPHRHEVLSLAFLEWLGAPDEDRGWIAAAIASHHRDVDELSRLYREPQPGDDDQLVLRLQELRPADIEALWRWVDRCAAPWIKELDMAVLGVEPLPLLPLDRAVQGLIGHGASDIYRWLARYQQWAEQLSRRRDIPARTVAVLLRGHLMMSDHAASAHVDALPRPTLNSRAVFHGPVSWQSLYQHQREAAAARGHALLVAPTGSGKTEAALLWAAEQGHNGQPPVRLFYTLPYQASMNAMRLRLGALLGEHGVGLQHGRALLALYRLLMQQNEYGPKEATWRARQMRELANLHRFPVRVFSPYQMLKAFYRLNGYEALLSDLADGVFILDEIHAYEVGRLAIILKSIQYLARNYDAKFLVMSATFPTLIRQALLEALGGATEISATPGLFAEFQRHRLHLLQGELLDPPNLEQIAADARRGLSVLVCCTTVQRSQQAYDALCGLLANQGVHPELLHGGFNMRDRSRKEQIVRDRVGPEEAKRRPLVLVATQVVEVSLDIDLDTTYSEPAPLEALVQRFGRINRRRKQKDLAPVHVFRSPDDGQHIYDPELIRRTLRILEREEGKPIDESAIGAWLDEIYSGELAVAWQQEYRRAAREFEGACLRELVPFAASPDLAKMFYRAFDGIDVLPKTLEPEYERLGQENMLLAHELTVSISFRRLMQLRKAQLTWESDEGIDGPIPIEVPYDSERGFDWSVLQRKQTPTEAKEDFS